jgi:hypothetical protein
MGKCPSLIRVSAAYNKAFVYLQTAIQYAEMARTQLFELNGRSMSETGIVHYGVKDALRGSTGCRGHWIRGGVCGRYT